MGLFDRRKGTAEKQNEARPLQEIGQKMSLPSEEAKRHSDSMVCYQHLQEELQSGHQGVAMKFYIQNFRRMNELFGFEYCERLLSRILDYLEEQTQCKVYRYVGVEFIVILRDYNQRKTISLVETILERFKNGWEIDDADCICNIHVGLCSYPGYADTPEELLKCLDLAVSHSMENDGSRYAFYDQKMHLLHLRHQAIARNLASALEKHELEMRYRTTYDVKKQKFTRAEFYIRIFVPELGMVGGVEFIPIAEESGQIRTLMYYVLDETAAKIADLLKQEIEFESVAVWISPVLLEQADFVDKVAEVIQKYQVPAGKLAIEIDGNDISTSYNMIMDLTTQLSDLGVELILNNYGSGASGLSQMLKLPADILKFDRMYIWQMDNDPQSESVIEGLIHIAEKQGKRVIAEGVETEHQIELLDRFGCELRQGFYYAPTIPEALLSSILGRTMEECQDVLDQERIRLK
jgi:EAL domain-containing protein (putative c-di-GMP-specific phosphodiesterase class I)/GGDEF domain-containing protein